jgi:nucleotide-binding universal stress UspA family protein
VSKNTSKQIIHSILVAVDGSETSSNAAKMAIDLSKKFGANLIALHIVPPNLRFNKEMFDIANQNGQKIVNEVREKAVAKGVDVQTEVISDVISITKVIVDYAEENDVNLIVLGTRGISGIKRLLLGSTASGVVTYSHCPVMVVR